jgi:hypothetical protein
VSLKRRYAAAAALLVTAAAGVGAQSAGPGFNAERYTRYFFSDGKITENSPYMMAPSDTDYDTFAVLGGKETSVDTPLEFALLSY